MTATSAPETRATQGPGGAGGAEGARALTLPLLRQVTAEEGGFRVWQPQLTPAQWEPSRTALVLCDVWDRHTCRGAEERLARWLPRMGSWSRTLREAGRS